MRNFFRLLSGWLLLFCSSSDGVDRLLAIEPRRSKRNRERCVGCLDADIDDRCPLCPGHDDYEVLVADCESEPRRRVREAVNVECQSSLEWRERADVFGQCAFVGDSVAD
jgi:hypothetical protein